MGTEATTLTRCTVDGTLSLHFVVIFELASVSVFGTWEDTVRHVEKDELGAGIDPELKSASMQAYVGGTVNNAEST